MPVRVTVLILLCFTYTVAELVGKEYRGSANIAADIFWAVGYITLAGLAYLIRNWVILQVVLASSLVFQFAYQWYVTNIWHTSVMCTHGIIENLYAFVPPIISNYNNN